MREALGFACGLTPAYGLAGAPAEAARAGLDV